MRYRVKLPAVRRAIAETAWAILPDKLEAILSSSGAQPGSHDYKEIVTIFNSMQMDFTVTGTDGASAAALVEAFKRR